MAKAQIVKGATDQTVYVKILDSTSTTGAGLTGLAYNTASLTCYYVRTLGSATAITLATQTVGGAHSDGGFVEVHATNMPGLYRLDLPDAVCATSARVAVVQLKGAANMVPVELEIELTDTNNQDAVRMGLTALPNAVAGASGGMWILGAMTGSPALTGSLLINNAAGTALGLIGSGTAIAATSTGGDAVTFTAPATGRALHLNGGTYGLRIDCTAATGVGIFADAGGSGGAALQLHGNGGKCIYLETPTSGADAGKCISADGTLLEATYLATDTITAAKIAANAITTSELADGTITAAKLASDCITSAKIDSTVGGEIADAVWDEPSAGHTTPGTYGDQATEAEIADAIWDEARSGHATAGTFGEGVSSVQGNVTGSVASVTTVSAGGITASSIATGAIDADSLATDAVNEIADGLLARTDGIETGVTPKQAMRAVLATTAGKITNADTTTNTFLAPDGSTARVTAVVDVNGNRSSVTISA